MNIDLGVPQTNVRTDRPTYNVGRNTLNPAPAVTQPENHQRWTKLTKARGRQPKDPHAQSVRFQCRDVDDQERQLQDYLQNPTSPAEHTTLEFVYPVSAAFNVYTADFKNKHNTQKDARAHHLYGRLDRSAVSVIDALARTEDPKDHMRRQKAIAKICMEACERADGFRYSFHNSWQSREDEAFRFSYFCNDSTLNKGRAANEGAGTAGKKIRKPVYDCQGLIAVKFSQTKQNLEVHYKHIPLHTTYAERAPPPRKDSKRYKLLEVFSPEELPPAKRAKKLPQNGAEILERPRKRKVSHHSVIVEGSEEVISIEPGSTTAISDINDPPTAEETHFMPLSQNSEVLLSQQPTTTTDERQADYRQIENQTTGRTRRMARLTAPKSTSPNKGLRWTMIDHSALMQGTSAAATTNESSNSAVRSETNVASNTITMLEFQALKTKLEEAEQRIKKLEAEKQSAQTVGPPPSQWGSYPTPSHYPYQYAPSSYPYPAQAIPPPGYQQPHVPIPTPQTRVEGQQLQYPTQTSMVGTHLEQAGENAVTGPTSLSREPRVRAKDKQSAVRGFVSYTPKPQKPVLNAQKQDTVRP